MLPYFEVHVAGFSATTTSGPALLPVRAMPRGKTMSLGSVLSGQSMVRPLMTASPLSFQSTRVHATASARERATIAPAATIEIRRWKSRLIRGLRAF